MIAAFYRGFAVKRHGSIGGMLAVGLGAKDVSDHLLDSNSDITIACENSPNSVTLSGHITALHQAKRHLDAQNIFTRELKTGKAYHSSHMEPVGAIYSELLQFSIKKLDSNDLAWQRPRARMFSSVTGEEITSRHMDVSYWVDNLRNRVRFDSAFSALGATSDLSDVRCMIEVGPHSALSGPFKQICIANSFDRLIYIPTLVRNKDDAAQLLSTAGSLFLQDYPLILDAVNAIEPSNRTARSSKRINPLLLVDLPTYEWNYAKTYWAEPRPSAEQRSLKHPRHDLLGSRISGK